MFPCDYMRLCMFNQDPGKGEWFILSDYVKKNGVYVSPYYQSELSPGFSKVIICTFTIIKCLQGGSLKLPNYLHLLL